eukprot:6496544-Pyramimonas_sp.AAC.1
MRPPFCCLIWCVCNHVSLARAQNAGICTADRRQYETGLDVLNILSINTDERNTAVMMLLIIAATFRALGFLALYRKVSSN